MHAVTHGHQPRADHLVVSPADSVVSSEWRELDEGCLIARLWAASDVVRLGSQLVTAKTSQEPGTPLN
jgi:hypothetical protein